MARSYFEKLVLILCVTGCIMLCCSVSVASSLKFVNHAVITYQVSGGETVVVDCSTVEPAYDTSLAFVHNPVPGFLIAPDGKKLVQEGQLFAIKNITKRDEGLYMCIGRDKQLKMYVKPLTAVSFRSYPDNSTSNLSLYQEKKPAEETAAMKLRASKPYLYFKQKSPLRFHVKEKHALDLSFSVKGLQPIKTQWKKDERELMIGSRYKAFDSGRRLLVDPPFTTEDSGIYSVSACNSKGCAVKGIQVLFYVIHNNTQTIQGKQTADASTQDEEITGNFMTKYGFLGIPAALAIILIIAIACTAGSGRKSKKKTKIEVIEKVHIQKERGDARSTSLWSWQSDGESSPDEMPDYDKIKAKKRPRKDNQITVFNDSANQPEYNESNYYPDQLPRDAEPHYGKHIYGSASEHRGQRHYDHEENDYSVRESREDNRQQESYTENHRQYGNYNAVTQERKHSQQDIISNDQYNTTNSTQYSSALQGNYNNDGGNTETRDGLKSQVNEGYNVENVKSANEEIYETIQAIYASYTGHVQGGIQPMRAQVLTNREAETPMRAQLSTNRGPATQAAPAAPVAPVAPAAPVASVSPVTPAARAARAAPAARAVPAAPVARYTRAESRNDEDEFMFYPDIFDFD